VGRASDWLREERRRTLGDWAAFCLGCGHVQRYFAEDEAELPSTCPTCGGQGQVRMQQGFFSLQQTCPRCHGTGKIIPEPCPACSGAGRLKTHKTLSVKIPAGVDEGDRIRLAGEGESGVNGGPPGDLYVQLRLKPHAIFQRNHDDLHCEMPVSFATAALGGEIDLPTLDGSAKIRVPADFSGPIAAYAARCACFTESPSAVTRNAPAAMALRRTRPSRKSFPLGDARR